MRRRVTVALTALLGVAALGGCGRPDVGGSGRLERVEGGGAGDHLILEGTPYEMGWWHGRLLKDRIRALHEEWQRQAFALDGDLMSEATQARRKAALALVEPVLQNHLPEAVRQEYQGLSDACGLPVRTLLLTEMITDILRFTEKEPRLLGGSLRVGSAGFTLWPDGSWARLLVSRWIWITRRRSDGPSASVLTWPGGLGAVLSARSDGIVAAAVEHRMDAGREGLAGMPFGLSLRHAGERAVSPDALLGTLSRTTGHEVLSMAMFKGVGQRQLLALTPDEAQPAAIEPAPVIDVDSKADLTEVFRRFEATGSFWVRVDGTSLWLSLDTGGGDRGRFLVP
jgi:hypothetical protein